VRESAGRVMKLGCRASRTSALSGRLSTEHRGLRKQCESAQLRIVSNLPASGMSESRPSLTVIPLVSEDSGAGQQRQSCDLIADAVPIRRPAKERKVPESARP
jgi:hypothetical protein